MSEYDFIIAGGGTAGLCVAGRLAEGSNVSVLVVEAGKDSRDVDQISTPGLAFNLAGSEYGWAYDFTKVDRPDMQRTEGCLTRGKVLGGSGALNYYSWMRGSKGTYDEWSAYGGDDWTWDKCFGYLRKSASFYDESGLFADKPPAGDDEISRKAHLKLSSERKVPLQALLQEAWKIDGLCHVIRAICDGVRSSSTCFLKDKPNITVLTETMTRKTNIEDGTAVGLEVQGPAGVESHRARHEVILSCGAFETPKLLMLSGIGPARELDAHDIACVVDSPHVGQNLQDHPIFPHGQITTEPWQSITRVNEERLATCKEWRERMQLGYDPLGPRGQPHFEFDLLPLFAKPFQPLITPPSCGQYMTVIVSLLRPLSRGRVSLCSCDAKDKPHINLNFLSDDLEAVALREGVRFIDEVISKGDGMKSIVLGEYPEPVPRESDEMMQDFILRRVSTGFYQCGSCRIGKSIEEGALDSHLKVFGVSKLRVADASTMPIIPDGRIQNAVYMIAEKPSDTVRKRSSKKRKLSRTAQLEEKLDGLVSLLKSTAQSTPASAVADITSRRDSTTGENIQTPSPIRSGSQTVGSNDDELRNNLSNRTVLPPATVGLERLSSQSPSAAALCELGPSMEEDEDNLERFRSKYLKYYPFTWIPSSTTAQQLRHDRPYFWLCIMSITTRSSSRQLDLDTRIRHILAQKIALELERSMDLLLAVLTYCAWGRCQRQMYNTAQIKPYMHVYTQLAVAVIYGLGLNKHPPKESHAFHGCNPTYHLFPKATPSSARTMEEHTLRWTSHMDESLQILAEKQEYPTDIVLVQLVKLQLITEKAAQGPWNQWFAENAHSHEPPPAFYLHALQSQVLEVVNKIPPELQHNEMVLMQKHYTELTIQEVSLSRAPIMSNITGFQRLESLYSCLSSAKAFMDIFRNTTPAELVGMPFSTFSQFGNCLIVLYKLSTLEDPAWDKSMVRNTADVLLIIDEVLQTMGHITEFVAGPGQEDRTFLKGAMLMRSLRQKWAENMSPASGDGDTSLNRQDPEDILGSFQLGWPDDAWLNDIFMW
ncbi:glucose-methanol-choline (gmc) oxidoreductase [Paecilomyces variotii No. 5]|uniref:Glucose-methanol-choline (Gmc) oxidoreductase n=1 Tax=Byssochlamys spectabilis (strain No. 5 / NBRC 109023) TaxID=1356009 RepID=V5F6W4_BYSSN|nr:glucose-methanol-choline (gmc) oxidoreductase [Paecilomyces variotii No. 5]